MATAVAEPLTGTPDRDVLAGRAGPSRIAALGGDDVVYGDPLSGVETEPGAVLLSVAQDGRQGRGDASEPVMSPNGQLVAFTSDADNLLPGDDNRWPDVFVKNVVTGELVRLSAPATGTDWGESHNPTISPDGKSIAFSSDQTGYVPGDENAGHDIFIRHLATGAFQRVSTRSDGGEANGYSGEPAFSPDGRRIAFHSWATNLVDGDTNGVYDVFVKNLDTQAVDRISVTQSRSQANRNCLSPVFSPDGSSILFVSEATNLVPGDTNKRQDVFLKNLATGELTRVSVSSTGAQANGVSGYAATPFSPDGTKIAFFSAATNLVSDDTNRQPDVFVKTLSNGKVERVSIPATPSEGTGGGGEGSFSPDGTKVAFTGWPSRFFPALKDNTPVVLIKDLQTGAVGVASRNRKGGIPNDGSSRPSFSADGRSLLFVSNASDFAEKRDRNGYYADIFLAELVPGPVGADVIAGGGGDDALFGLRGADRIDGGAGDDRIDGGEDVDVADFGRCASPVTASVGRSGSGKSESADCGSDTLLAIESVRGGLSKDKIAVATSNGVLEGAGGDDELIGGKGRQAVSYRSATASVRVNLASGRAFGASEGRDRLANIEDVVGSDDAAGDVIVGNAFSNRLEGRAGPDVIDGGDGNDLILGGAGRDRLSGGAGADLFRWAQVVDSLAADPDMVLDFRRADRDQIDLTPLGSLTFVGSEPFTGPMQLRAIAVKTTMRLEVNIRGSTKAEMAITLRGVSKFDPRIDMPRE